MQRAMRNAGLTHASAWILEQDEQEFGRLADRAKDKIKEVEKGKEDDKANDV